MATTTPDTPASTNPFEFINNITSSNKSIWGAESDTAYAPFMVNRGLSQFSDTVLLAQLINEKGSYLSPKMQYDFYRTAITHKKKRFAKWHKPDKLEKVAELALHFGINTRIMESYISLMTDEQYAGIVAELNQGGKQSSIQRKSK